MNLLVSLFPEAWVQRLGWVLIHFLWEGTIIALVLAFLLRLLAKASSHTRYVSAGAALLVCAIAPIITWMALAPPEGGASPVTELGTTSVLQFQDSNSSPSPALTSNSQALVETGTPWQAKIVQAATALLPYTVGLWFVGVLTLSTRLMLGWIWMKRLCRSSIPAKDPQCLEKFKSLLTRMRISQPVRLLESALVEVPTLIGWLRPTILIPISLFVDMTPDQLEAIFAHELAHVRRYDYLVNIFQTAIETILFYHPAVWVISSKLREERENCCDDIALDVTANRLLYVSALAQLEEGRIMPLALSASGGTLLKRIKRIIGAGNRKTSAWPLWILIIGVFAAACLTKHEPTERVEFQIAGHPVQLSEKAQAEVVALFEQMMAARYINGTPDDVYHWEIIPSTSPEEVRKEGAFLHIAYAKEKVFKVNDNFLFKTMGVWIGLQDNPMGESYPGHPGGIFVVNNEKSDLSNIMLGSKSLLTGIGLNPEIYPHLSAAMQKTLDAHRKTYQAYVDWTSKTDSTGQPINQEVVVAVQAGDIATLKRLIAQGIDLKSIKGSPTLLFNAASPEVAELLIQQGITVDARNDSGQTALSMLCLNQGSKAAPIIRILLEHGANPNAYDDAWKAPVFYSALDGSTVDILAEHGANLQLRGKDGMSPFELGYSDPSYYQALIKHGVPFDLKTDGTQLMVHAAWSGNIKTVTWLLQQGVDPNTAGLWFKDEHSTKYDHPLTDTAITGNEKMATLLLEHGANGEEAMGYAMRNHSIKMVKLLWDHAVRNISELTYAISQGASLSDLEKLLQNGMPAEPPQDKIISPLGEAAEMGNLPAVQLLVQHGADVNKGGVLVKDHPEYVFTPLVLAADKGHDDIVEFLLQHGARPDPRALELAASAGIPTYPLSQPRPSTDHFQRTVQLLIDAGALKNVAPEVGGNILASSISTCRGDPDPVVVHKLLDAGLSSQAPTKALDGTMKPVIDVLREYSQQQHTIGTERYKPYLEMLEKTEKGAATSSMGHKITGASSKTMNPALTQALVAAVKAGDIAEVELQLKQGADPNDAQDSDGMNALLIAVNGDHSDIVSLLLQNGANPNSKESDPDVFALSYAKNVAMVQILLDAGADPNGKSDFITPLSDAPDPESVRLLVQHGANLNPKLRNGMTLLEDAVGSELYQRSLGDRWDVIAELIKQGAKFDPTGNGPLLLTLAAGEGKINIAGGLIQAGVNPDTYCNETSRSPLTAAAFARSPEMIKLLLSRGAHLSASQGNASPLSMALNAGRYDNADILRQAGEGDVGFFSEYCARGNLAKVNELIKTGANVNEVDKFGQTPLMYAVRRGYPEIAKVLLEHGANIDQFNSVGDTAYVQFEASLELFSQYPNISPGRLKQDDWGVHADEATRRLTDLELIFKEHPFNPNYQDASGQTALHQAALAGNTWNFGQLLALKPDINAKDNNGNTPLLLAAFSPVASNLTTRYIDKVSAKEWNAEAHIAEQLIEAGAKLDLVLANGKTVGESAMAAAIKAKNSQLISVLHDAGVAEAVTSPKSSDKAAVTKVTFDYVSIPTALKVAIDSDDFVAAKQLLANGARPEEFDMVEALAFRRNRFAKLIWEQGGYYCSPLAYAISQGTAVIDVEAMLKKGSAVEPAEDQYITPLAIAAENGNLPIVKMLLDHGADPNYLTAKGHTDFSPLEQAVTTRNPEMVALLLDRGAHPGIMAVSMALNGAAKIFPDNLRSPAIDIVKMLAQHGAFEAVHPKMKGRLLNEACLTDQNAELVQLLLAQGYSPKEIGPDGRTPVIELVRDASDGKNNWPFNPDFKLILGLLEAVDKGPAPSTLPSNAKTGTL